MLGNFNELAQFVLLKSKEEMIELKHPYIGTEHLLLSILKNDEDLSKKLSVYGLTYDKFRNEIIAIIGKSTKQSNLFLYTPLLKKVIDNSLLDAKDNNNGEVTPNHLLSALLEIGEGIAVRILVGMNINVDELYEEFSYKIVRKKKKKRKLLIEELGVNLVEKAKNKKLDPVVGRDKEINRVIEILCRRCKNNPLLLGEAGVGKTAIVEALANLIAINRVPVSLRDKKIISLDMASVVSGTKYRGEFEERMNKIIKEVEDEDDIILFIDEIHTLVGAGGAEGAIDASNILKPSLARGNIRIIGATTTCEYKKFIEEDKALERRFQSILIEEPNMEATCNILEKLVPIYEKYHKVRIPNDILEIIVDLSNRYITNRYNPDKSIDILDEVCSMVSIKETKLDKELLEITDEINEIKKVKTASILDNNMEKAYSYLKKESLLQSKMNKLSLKTINDKIITKSDIAIAINNKTGISVYEIMSDELSSISLLENRLNSEIFGQDKAIKSLINATKKLKLGYSNHKVKSYLFVGPTGVGKTNLAKIYSKVLMGDNNLIRLDMSEYSDSSSINKIIGSSPGYVGYMDNNNILSKIKEKPSAVILLDEIDKAHQSVINLLYQILDEGFIKDSRNNIVNLNNNIIIMTSNLGFEDNKLGFTKDVKSNIINDLKQKFSPSLINRIDNIIVFDRLTQENIKNIILNKLNNLKKKYNSFVYGEKLVLDIINESKYIEYGARKIDKIIDIRLEGILIEKILNNEKLVVESLGEYQVN